MVIERRNVAGLVDPPGYTHLATVTGGRLVSCAGQVPLDEHGTLVGPGDAPAQARQCRRNVSLCLATAGARPEDVVRTTVYVVAAERRVLGAVWQALLESELSALVRTPATLIGVTNLGYGGQLVEIECTATVPATSSPY